MGAAHPIDSAMYGASFGHAEMSAIFSEEAVQQRRLEVEAALAKAEAKHGIIPAAAAERIAAAARLEVIGLDRIVAHYRTTQNDVVALVRALGDELDQEAREYVHFGATSQDIHITGLALALRDAVDWLEEALARLERLLADVARRERDTLMAGRTHGQLANPITFGFKVAGWAMAVREHRIRLAELRPRLLLGSLKGAVGTHAAIGERGPDVERELMASLGLGVSPINIQPSEERYAELLNWCGLVAMSIARFAADVRGLHRSEVGEVRERFDEGAQVGSSTMPHKRNPEWAETAQGIAYVVQAHSVAMTRVLQEHERDATRNGPEHLLIPESCILTANLVSGAREAIDGLEIDRQRMKENLGLMYGLMASEAVLFAVTARTGQKETAHHVVYDCAHRAFRERRPFAEVLAENAWLQEVLAPGDLQAALEPASYVGTCAAQVDAVLAVLREPPSPSGA